MNINYNDRVNIFTDASTKSYDNNKFYSCAGALLLLPDNSEKAFCRLLKNSTNNKGEMEGILLGIHVAIKYYESYGNSEFNIFSDSLIGISSLRKYVYGWKFKDGKIYGGSGSEVKNDDIIIHCMKLINDNPNINIRIYHQNGHININRKSDLKKALYTFNKNNCQNIQSTDFIRSISYFNNKIDKVSRDLLKTDQFFNDYNEDYIGKYTYEEKKSIVDTYKTNLTKELYFR